MTSFTFIISSEPYKFEAIDSLLNLGTAIIKKGHEIRGIYLFGSGVYNIKSGAHTGDEVRNLPEKLQNFCLENNIEIGGCSTWLSFTGIKKEEFIENGCIMGLGELSEWVEESDNVIFFGTGA
jgi:sulfur relay (sulfurtransferase) complex TusBCD TusD component (DsrE family)